MKKIIDDFVDFLIKENCEGCKECNPKLPTENKPEIVCVNQGLTQWFLSMAEKYKASKRK